MVWNPKRKAVAFASLLLLSSVVLLGTAVANTSRELRPFVNGDDFGGERPLTRGQYRTLALHVGQEQGDGSIAPLAGATLAVVRFGEARGHDEEILATGTTDERGRAVFELKPGRYEVAIVSGSLVTTHAVPLGENLRVAVVFDQDGNAHWEFKRHKDLERRGEAVPLLVRVVENTTDGRTPVAGAAIRVTPHREGADAVENTTGPRGFALFHLHRGLHQVEVTVGDVTRTVDVDLQRPTGIIAVLDGGEIAFRVHEAPPKRPGPGPEGAEPPPEGSDAGNRRPYRR